jgi:hypothetical protein
MWFVAGSITGVILLTCATSAGKNAFKLGGVLFDTVKDKLLGAKVKKIEVIDIDDKALVVYEDITLVTTKIYHQYDVLCFHSDNIELNSNSATHNFDPINHIKKMIPMTVIRHGQYLSTVPFRPKDFGTNTLFVSIKKMNDNLHSVYKFSFNDYINLIDIINIYEVDSKMNENIEELAEAYD